MTEPTDPVTIALRIPGKWGHPKELLERMPPDIRLTPDTLVLPDGSEVEFGAAPADDQFAQVFRSACRQPPTKEELATVDSYKVNVFLSAPGGSMPRARTIMQAAAAILRAGGGGVFIDNCGLAHGGGLWLQMTEDGGSDALTFAFVAIVRDKTEVYTMGMHVLGLREVVMKRTDIEVEGFDIIEVIRYLAQGEKPIEDGHVLADLSGPRFRVMTQTSARFTDPGSPMHNPYGQLKLVSMRDIAENN